MNYLTTEMNKSFNKTFFINNLKSMKKCNAITCIHNSGGFCTAFEGSKCDFYEDYKIQEQ
ncbi:MAG: hypothetical protein ACPLW7_00660 [Minisyncoccia bacterium]